MSSVFDVAVVGSGIAGLTAACGTAGRGLSTCCVELLTFGGLVVSINELDPSPSPALHSGADLATSLAEKAAELGVEFMFDSVTALQRTGSTFTLTMEGGSLEARTVILASGARQKPLGVPGEAAFEHRGIGHCADCDGPLHEGNDVVVVGGGDSAVQEALVLAKFCRSVFIVHHGRSFTAKAHFADQARQIANIHPLPDSEVTEIRGGEGVGGVLVRSLSDGSVREISCTAVFPYVGLKPDLDYVKVHVSIDEAGFVAADADGATGVPGLFAAGLVRAGCGGLLSDAIADAERAAGRAADALMANGVHS